MTQLFIIYFVNNNKNNNRSFNFNNYKSAQLIHWYIEGGGLEVVKANSSFIYCNQRHTHTHHTLLQKKRTRTMFAQGNGFLALVSVAALLLVLASSAHGKPVVQMPVPGAKLTSLQLVPRGAQCACQGVECSCCAQIKANFTLPFLGPQVIDDTVCLDLSYNASDVSVTVAVLLNGETVFQETFAATDLLGFCVPIVPQIALSICVQFNNVQLTKTNLSACADAAANLAGITLVKEPLGCFDIPIPQVSKAPVH